MRCMNGINKHVFYNCIFILQIWVVVTEAVHYGRGVIGTHYVFLMHVLIPVMARLAHIMRMASHLPMSQVHFQERLGDEEGPLSQCGAGRLMGQSCSPKYSSK